MGRAPAATKVAIAVTHFDMGDERANFFLLQPGAFSVHDGVTLLELRALGQGIVDKGLQRHLFLNQGQGPDNLFGRTQLHVVDAE